MGLLTAFLATCSFHSGAGRSAASLRDRGHLSKWKGSRLQQRIPNAGDISFWPLAHSAHPMVHHCWPWAHCSYLYNIPSLPAQFKLTALNLTSASLITLLRCSEKYCSTLLDGSRVFSSLAS